MFHYIKIEEIQNRSLEDFFMLPMMWGQSIETDMYVCANLKHYFHPRGIPIHFEREPQYTSIPSISMPDCTRRERSASWGCWIRSRDTREIASSSRWKGPFIYDICTGFEFFDPSSLNTQPCRDALGGCMNSRTAAGGSQYAEFTQSTRYALTWKWRGDGWPSMMLVPNLTPASPFQPILPKFVH